ncbi:MAG: hypothetical protein N2C12_04915, partial [Planctomycetales bacterium]
MQSNVKLAVVCLASFVTVALALSAQPAGGQPPDKLLQTVPKQAENFSPEVVSTVQALVQNVEQWAVGQSDYDPEAGNDQILQTAGKLIDLKQNMDKLLDRTLAVRTQFVEQPAGEDRR